METMPAMEAMPVRKIVIALPGTSVDARSLPQGYCCHTRMLESEVVVKYVQISQDTEGVMSINLLDTMPPG